MKKYQKYLGLSFLAGLCIMWVKNKKKTLGNVEEKYMDSLGGRYSVCDIANWFLIQEKMDQKKLQKMCYFAYSWYLYFSNDIENGLTEKLFDNDIEGWVHGPVSRKLYSAFPFKGMQLLSPSSLFVNLDEETINILEQVYSVYKDYTGNELEAMTHKESPWIESRKGLASYEPGTQIIRDETIFNYFSFLANE